MQNNCIYRDEVVFRTAKDSEIPQLGAIYAQGFPHQRRTILGSSGCAEFLRAVLRNPAYDLLIAAGRMGALGLCVVHVDRTKPIYKYWVLRAIARFVFTSFRNPSRVVREFSQRRTARGAEHALQPTAKTRATALAKPLKRPSCYIDFITVVAEARGMGIGRGLLEAGIQTTRARGYDLVKLTVSAANQPAIALYERLGFQPVGLSVKSNSIVYQLELTPNDKVVAR
jgi:ribosomal protein S18 acetylase RimI-like enzyme